MVVEALDKDGGHSDADHGSHVTETQHELRLKTARTPNGRVPRTAPNVSSNFASDAMHLKAYKDALARLEVEKFNSRGGLKIRVELRAKPMRGAGVGYSLDPNGFLILSQLDSCTAVFALDTASGQYHLVTMFPE